MITNQELGVLGDLAQLSLDPESRDSTLQAINEVLELVDVTRRPHGIHSSTIFYNDELIRFATSMQKNSH